MNEFELIKKLSDRNRVVREDVIQGIGDDCARVQVPDGHELAITTDTLIAGVHFPEKTSPHAIGFKSLAANLSDLAAMGAEPAWVTLALSLPTNNFLWLDQFAEGFYTLAEEHQVALIGGDTTCGPLAITIQAQGLIPKGEAITRSGAKVGDYICVTGALGEAGYELMRLGGKPQQPTIVNRLNYPIPRISVGLALREIASSAIDVSDGLIADLGHILNASQVGARIILEDLPISSAMRGHEDQAMMFQLALTAGDDYELCFTVPDEHIERLNQLQYDLNLPIKHIGNIEEQPGLRIHRPDGEPLVINAGSSGGGYDHFSDKQQHNK